MQVPSNVVASKATDILKTEVSQAIKQEVNKLDDNFIQKVSAVISASMVAISAYAYLV
jgi:hypothetical protein